jgi:uncharacterized delta-60 repeat protein
MPLRLNSKAGRTLAFERLEAREVLTAVELDGQFGGDGMINVVDNYPHLGSHTPAAFAVQRDGKYLVGGAAQNGYGESFVISRFTPDGDLDRSFGEQGSRKTVFSAGYDSLYSLLVQPDNSFLAIGTSFFKLAIARYTPDGELDTTFDGDGYVSFQINDNPTSPYDAVLQSDGRIVVSAVDALSSLVLRFNTNGQLDTTFNSVGYVRTDGQSTRNLAIQSDGRIVLLSNVGINSDRGTLTRWSSDGSLDPTFGNGGIVTLDELLTGEGGLESNGTLALTEHDQIMLAYPTGGPEILLVRLTEQGTIDSSFGSGGVASIESRDEVFFLTSLVRDGSDFIVGATTFNSANYFDITLVRFDSEGVLQPSFGDGGVVVQSFERDQAWLERTVDLTVVGGKIVGGYAFKNPALRSKMAVVQFTSDGSLDTEFGVGGLATEEASHEYRRTEPESTAVLPDGSIVVVTNDLSSFGSVVFRRYRSEGSPDTSWGAQGSVVFDQGFGGVDRVLIAQPDGKLLFGATSHSADPLPPDVEIFIARLNGDGTRDISFGVNGTLSISNPGTYDSLTDLRTLADGSILAVGSDIAEKFISLRRILPSGNLDTNFGQSGVATIQLAHGQHRLIDSYVLADGRIQLVAEHHDYSSGRASVVVATYLPSGILDPIYATSGIATLDVSALGIIQASSAAWQNDGGILIGGFSAIARLTPEGFIDRNFGDGGFTRLETPADAWLSVTSLHLLPDSRFVAVEELGSDYKSVIQISVFLPDGRLDTSFGGGVKQFPLGTYKNRVLQAELLSPTRLLLVGTVQTETEMQMFLAKAMVSELAWQNPTNPLNVSNDPAGGIEPLDALIVINALNYTADDGARYLGGRAVDGVSRYLDVNGDDYLTAIDALIVINWLNANPVMLTSPTKGEGEPADEVAETNFLQPEWRLDDASVALLMSSLESKSKRRAL